MHRASRIIIVALIIGVTTKSSWASEPASLTTVDPSASPLISVVSGMYGTPGAKHVLNITAKLQDLCGTSAERCSVFCSDSTFGRYNLGRKPICRVTYRCGAADVRSVEAWREEPILMRCPEIPDGQAPVAVSATN